MFDTHVNLHAEAFAGDLPEVLARARAAGVTRMLAICDRFDNFETVHAIAAAHDDIWCTAGVHPHHAKDFPDLTAEALAAAAARREVVALGETGLDFHYGYSPEADQVRLLKAHFEAARAAGLPLVLHTREADDLMFRVLEEEDANGPVVPLLHCYTGGPALRDAALERGGYVSASGIVSFRNAHDVREVIAGVPLDRIIVETDCPYLTPMPYRGRRNEPAYVVHVIEALAKLYERDAGEIAALTEANARRLFHRVDA